MEAAAGIPASQSVAPQWADLPTPEVFVFAMPASLSDHQTSPPVRLPEPRFPNGKRLLENSSIAVPPNAAKIQKGFCKSAQMTILSHFAFCEAVDPAARGGVMSSVFKNRKPAHRAFSLVELLAVMAIIAIMIGMLAPALRGFTSSAGRKGAVNILMNTLEQAHAAALEKNCSVSVLLWRRDFPNHDAIMVVRDPSPWLLDSKGNTETQIVPLTKWISLPDGILLHKPTAGANIFLEKAVDAIGADNWSKLPNSGDVSPPQTDLVGAVKFNSLGVVVAPQDNKNARIVITEGVRGVGGTEAVIAGRKQQQTGVGGGFDIVSLSRFTGRPRLDVTTVQ